MARTVERSVGILIHGALCVRKSHKLYMIMSTMRKKRMKKKKPCTERLQLLPGLLDDVVLREILPRLPWYQRPRMMMVSKAWRSALKSPTTDLIPRSRELLKQRGLVLLCNFGREGFFLYFDTCKGTWHWIPPLPQRGDDVEECFCLEGAVYGICKGRLYKLDAGAGLWSWELLPTRTQIARDIEPAASVGGVLYICGRRSWQYVIRSPQYLLERHNMIDPSPHSILMDDVPRQSILAVQQKYLTGLFHGMCKGILSFPLVTEATVLTFVSGDEFYVVVSESFVDHLKLDGNGGVTLVSEINLQRELRLLRPPKIIAMAHQGGCLYVVLQYFRARISFWKGEPGAEASKDETRVHHLEKRAWSRLECPVQSGTLGYAKACSFES